MLAAAGGMGIAAVILLAAAVLFVAVLAPGDAWGSHEATQCMLTARGERMPVTYLGRERNNPDGTYYPGDAFYYLFSWEDRSDPGECSMHKPVLETEGLHANHTSRTIGPLDPVTGMVQSAPGADMIHKTLDPSVRLAPYTSYYGTDGPGESCRTVFAKPGQSFSTRWTKYAIYDEPFLTKQQKSPGLDDAEAAGASRRGDASWTVWEEGGRPGPGHGLDPCPFGHGQGRAHSDAPHALEKYRKLGKTFFYTTTYKWEFHRDASAAHPHAFDVLADNGTRRAFDARVSEVCGGLGPDSGCMHGTALIRPHGGQVCLYAEAGRVMGGEWMSNPDKDNDGVRDADETPEDGPPPHLLPPGIPASQYAPPARDECVSSGAGDPQLKLVIGGTYWTAHHRVQGGLEYPISDTRTVVADRSPGVSTALNAVLTKPPLLHADGGYDARNLDGTYYHDDPVHIRHEPSWKWADERAAHVNFTVVRLHDDIPVDDEYDCDTARQESDGMPGSSGRCANVTGTSSPNWLRQEKQYGNGDGRTVYVADTGFDFGTYDFAYNMTAYNLGEPAATNNGTDSTSATLVPYEPVYESVYSYPVLADAREYAFDDRRGMVVKYAGSAQDGVVHGERRSYVNWWNASGGGHNPYGYAEFDQPHVLAGGRSAPPDREPPVLAYNHNGAQAAMFTSAGYGVMHMDWPVSEHVFAEMADERTNRTARGAYFANVTAQAEFRSVDFAGMREVPLFSDVMRYPEMPFAKQVVVRSVDQHGSIQYGDALVLRVEPYGGIAEDQSDVVDSWWESGGLHGWLSGVVGGETVQGPVPRERQPQQEGELDREVLEGSELLTDYMRDKVMHDTGGDTIVTESVLNDTHGMVQEWSGRGVIDATVLRTSAYFADIAAQDEPPVPAPVRGQQPQSGAPDGLPRLPDLDELLAGLAGKPEGLRMSVPLDVGLSALPPTSVYVGINGGPERAFHHKYYAFGGSETISINVRTDNELEAERVGTNGTGLSVGQPGNFGAIAALALNGSAVHAQCAAGCVLSSVPYNETVSVTAWNEWGGEARAVVEPVPVRSAAPAAAEPEWRIFAGTAMMLAAGAYVMKKFFGSSMFGR